VLALAGFFHLVAGGARPLLEMIRPLLIHLQQPLEVVLVALALVDDQLALVFAGGVRGLDQLLLFPFDPTVGFLLLQLQDRVLFHLLLDPLLQGHDRQLQNLHGLDHPRSQHLLLHHAEFLAEGQSHGGWGVRGQESGVRCS
jgi:hypothetical protein